MKTDEQNELMIKRSYDVFKHNDLVRKNRYNLSVTEQRAIAYLCSLIKPVKATPKTMNVPFILEYEFDIWQYAKVCGLTSDGGQLYEETKSLLSGLIKKVMWLKLPNNTRVTVNWLSRVWINERSGKVKVKLDEFLIPYLFGLQEVGNFTAYGLINVLAMTCQYSIRIYEILKSYANDKTKTFDIDELKELLMVDGAKSYNRFPDFRRRVIEPAMAEINKYTDLTVSYEPITRGRKVVQVQFFIQRKDYIDSLLSNTWANTDISGSL